MGKPKPIHERVAEHVVEAELSNAEVAKLTGWSEQRVWRLLTGRTDLTAEDVEILAGLLKKPVAALYAGTNKAKAS